MIVMGPEAARWDPEYPSHYPDRRQAVAVRLRMVMYERPEADPRPISTCSGELKERESTRVVPIECSWSEMGSMENREGWVFQLNDKLPKRGGRTLVQFMVEVEL
ncbi:hypothetical protein H9P43_006709 [Blastocladiella emersonii ATCC 22665]|nr:hypothetical protein H9P43_006709 [Blastocladiella emersonii ATCC 22665]